MFPYSIYLFFIVFYFLQKPMNFPNVPPIGPSPNNGRGARLPYHGEGARLPYSANRVVRENFIFLLVYKHSLIPHAHIVL